MHVFRLVALSLPLLVLAGCGGTQGDTMSTSGSYSSYGGASSVPPTGANGAAMASGPSLALPVNRILFNTLDPTSGFVEVWSIDGEGKNKNRVLSLPSGASTGEAYVAYAPHPTMANGCFFAYRAKAGGQVGIYRNSSLSIVNATQVVPPTYSSVGQLAVSPDGTTLAYTAAVEDGVRKLYRVAASGTSAPSVLDVADQIAISPVGDVVAYTKVNPEKRDVFVRPLVATGEARQVTKTPDVDERDISFKRDGQRLAFTSGNDLFTLKVKDGGDVKQVTKTGPLAKHGPSFNNDGSQIAFVGIDPADGTKTGVYRVSANGGEPKLVLADASVGSEVEWTPSSNQTAASASIGFKMDLNPRVRKQTVVQK